MNLSSITFNVDNIDYENCSISVSNVAMPTTTWSGGPSDITNMPGFTQWFNNLTPTEKTWVQNNWTAAGKAFVNYLNAETTSRLYYSKANPSKSEIINPLLLPDKDGTNQNAFKHVLAAALHTKYLGSPTAWTIVSNHELGTPENLFKQMDIANNGIGINIGNECSCSESEIATAVKKLVDKGGAYRAVINNINTPTLQRTNKATNDENY
ncbi:DUF6973 domain-containing protein [Dyadobacter sp. 3J3]|uniref:DUF6973 domain-containing protein n=1 Tax=Dyadobacter sp. 3J3 TaxID=2606600 RepID=UPI00135C44EF|nr:hypothetical protein [Dyadobacter sp. 3J3]